MLRSASAVKVAAFRGLAKISAVCSATRRLVTYSESQMNLPEDRHPLLYVYLDDDQPERVRSRCVAQGATTLLGKWPDHITYSWMMAVTGLLSLLACFLLAIVFLMTSSSFHDDGKRALMAKCERNEHVVQIVHMKNLEDLTVDENATYFVEIALDKVQKSDTMCSVESFLKRTTLPVFLVSISLNKTLQNLTICHELEEKFKNFKVIPFDLSSFFNKTVFANFQSQKPKFLKFLAKALVSWNVGGTVIDSNVKTLKDFEAVVKADDKALTIGKVNEDVVLISAKRFCHVYVFDILKTITEMKDVAKYSDLGIIKAAQKRFCHGRWNCTGIKILSAPEFCDNDTVNDKCTFLLSKPGEKQFSTHSNFSWKSLCPLTKALT